MEPIEIPWNHVEVSRNPMEPIEIPWNHVEVSRRSMESHGILSSPMESFEIPCNYFEVSRSPQEVLGTSLESLRSKAEKADSTGPDKILSLRSQVKWCRILCSPMEFCGIP